MTTVPTLNDEATTPTILDLIALKNSLTAAQRIGRACVVCGNSLNRFVPAGKIGDVDVVECDHHAPQRKRERDNAPTWLTAPCPGWCHDDHHGSDHPDDRRHGSGTTGVPLRTMAFENFGSPAEPSYKPLELMADLEQLYREIEPRVVLCDDSDKWFRRLSLGETRDFALNLIELFRAGRTGTDLVVSSSPGGAAECTPWCTDHDPETGMCRAAGVRTLAYDVRLSQAPGEPTAVHLDDEPLSPEQAEEVAFALLAQARRARQTS